MTKDDLHTVALFVVLLAAGAAESIAELILG